MGAPRCCASVRNFFSFMFQKLWEGFLSLKGSSKDLYIIFVLQVLDSFAYFVMSLMYTLFLTNKFGISDTQAGLSYGLWGMLITVNHVVFSPVVDFIGVKKSLLIGFFLASVGRALMASTHSVTVLWVALYGFMPTAAGFSGTMLLVGIKRYANPAGRGFAYGLFYSLMNVAAFANGSVFDVFRRKLVNGLKIDSWGPDSMLNDGLRLYLLVTVITTIFSFILSLFLDENVCLEDPEAPEPKTKPEELMPKVKFGRRILNFIKELKDLWSMTLLKFLIVCALTINLKQIFRHLDATFPKYQIRAFGCDAPVGLTYSINPFMIIFMVPVVQAILTKYNHYDVIHFGSYITGLSPFFLVFSQTKWASAVFVVMLSIGESVWSPRWYDYSMSIAPHGREAIFSGLASAPLFLAKLPTGWLSGWILAKWCPKNVVCERGELPIADPQACNGSMVWLVIGCLTLSSPICLLLGSKWLRSTGSHQPKPVKDDKLGSTSDAADETQPLLEN
ncbi:hypothetical protein BSKO_03140 [Bryopsis sp. KO-2023]|nr:hypothetical protein BSKO_03140 [Bryopsis sp. KO-2023]